MGRPRPTLSESKTFKSENCLKRRRHQALSRATTAHVVALHVVARRGLGRRAPDAVFLDKNGSSGFSAGMAASEASGIAALTISAGRPPPMDRRL
jgi:hypothetical protein